jgi:hypothetical protein
MALEEQLKIAEENFSLAFKELNLAVKRGENRVTCSSGFWYQHLLMPGGTVIIVSPDNKELEIIPPATGTEDEKYESDRKTAEEFAKKYGWKYELAFL